MALTLTNPHITVEPANFLLLTHIYTQSNLSIYTMTDDTISAELLAQFTDTPYACTSLTKLSGGTGNFVYRGSLRHPLPDGTDTVVFKHAKDYLASNREFKLSPERCVIIPIHPVYHTELTPSSSSKKTPSDH